MGRPRSTTASGRIYGPEPWRTLRGVELSHWDLWFVVAIRDVGGKRELVRALKIHARQYSFSAARDVERKLSHLFDLETRLLASGVTHDDVLAEVVVDYSLLRKARAKVLDQWVSHPTQAMIDTPRRILNERAMRGYWTEFPVNPKQYEAAFGRFARGGEYYDYRAAPMVADLIENAWRVTRLGAPTGPNKVAVDRATMTAIVELMDHVDDSGGDMGNVFEDVLGEYVAAVWSAEVAPDVILRDGIELGVWEDYGLSSDMGAFIRGVPGEHGGLASRIFAETTAELYVYGLEYGYSKALSMWAELLVAHERFDDFPYVAGRIGSNALAPIVRMAECAWRSGRGDVAKAVFDGADETGPYRERLREAALRSFDRT